MPTTINGNGSRNNLLGTWGDDLINGGAGADVMSGGGGNDIYIVDNVGDVVFETPARHISNATLIRLASSNAQGTRGEAASLAPAISGDGSLVVFYSQANNLYADFNPLDAELVLKDFVSGSALPLHTASNGEPGAPGPNEEIDITADGRFVVFTSAAINLGDDGQTTTDIYVKDLSTGEVTWESQAGVGGGSDLHRFEPVISDDGRYVAFTAIENLLGADDNDVQDTDVFLRDRQTGQLILVSGSEDGATQGSGGESDSSAPSIALFDGVPIVAFQSSAGLLPGAFDGNGHTDIFLKEAGEPGLLNVTEALARALNNGAHANGPSISPVLTPDAHFLVFSSLATNLRPNDFDPNHDIYRLDLRSGNLRLVNTSRTGEVGTHHALAPDISADGRFVVFESFANNLVPIANDTGRGKIFVKDLVTGDIELVSRNSNGSLITAADATDAHISADGRFIVFSTAAVLTSNDGGDLQDVYRVPNPLYSPADAIWASVSYTLPDGVENLILTGTGAINGAGNTGNNAVTGNSGANVLQGGAGADRLFGLAGADLLSGDAGNDFIVGGTGRDTASYASAQAGVAVNLALSAAQNTAGGGRDTLVSIEDLAGSRFNDTLRGSAGTNQLRGGAGKDSLFGGGGADLIIGGSGRDIMTGGTGADRFRLERVSDTGLKKGLADVIKDFVHGQGDRIDLSALDARGLTATNEAFRFIGTRAFSSGDASGQLRWEPGTHLLYGSTDADRTPEFVISLPGVTTLVASDFIL